MSSQVRIASTTNGRQVHVLYLIDELCRLGGAERALLSTIRRLPTDRFRCSLICFRCDSSLRPVLDGLPCSTFVWPLRKTYDWNALQTARMLRRFIREEDVAIVHTFFETADIWGGFVAKLSGVPVLISARRDMGIYRSAKHRFAYRLLRRQFDAVLTVSEAVRSFIIRHDHMPPDRVKTIYNSLENSVITMPGGSGTVRAKLGIKFAAPLIVTVAHVRKVKGIDVLVRAAANVVREFPDAVLAVVGGVSEPEYFKEIKELIQTLGLNESVRFIGEMEDVRPVLKASDLFCLPSRSEGFSNALIEAMHAGLPCVATRVGGNAEALADESTGYLVNSEDSDALAERICLLLRDPELRLRMGREAHRVAESRFSMESMINQLTDVYEQLLVAKNA